MKTNFVVLVVKGESRPGAPGSSHLGTWETTDSMARKRRLAPPQVVADNYPHPAHNEI